MLREPAHVGNLALLRDAREPLEAFVGLLERWQATHNLVGPGTLEDIWERHIADSAQLVELFPKARRWLDLGSGAGFPGLVVAILLRNVAGASVALVESNAKKCAFLREAVRVTGAPADVVCDRIESVAKRWTQPVDIVTARALAPLSVLCAFVEPLLARGAVAVFHKGRAFDAEMCEARQTWDIDLVEHRSRVGEGVLIEIRRLRRRTEK